MGEKLTALLRQVTVDLLRDASLPLVLKRRAPSRGGTTGRTDDFGNVTGHFGDAPVT